MRLKPLIINVQFSNNTKLITFAKRNNDNTIMLLQQNQITISQLIDLQTTISRYNILR